MGVASYPQRPPGGDDDISLFAIHEIKRLIPPGINIMAGSSLRLRPKEKTFASASGNGVSFGGGPTGRRA